MLEDLDWVIGRITVVGGGQRRLALLITGDVGQAILAWLQVRPAHSEESAVFVRIQPGFVKVRETRGVRRLDADALDRLAGVRAQGMAPLAAIVIDGKKVRSAKNGGGTKVHPLAVIEHATVAVSVQENGLITKQGVAVS